MEKLRRTERRVSRQRLDFGARHRLFLTRWLSLHCRQALPYLPSPTISPSKSILTGLVDNVDGGPLQPSQRSLPVYSAQSLRQSSLARSHPTPSARLTLFSLIRVAVDRQGGLPAQPWRADPLCLLVPHDGRRVREYVSFAPARPRFRISLDTFSPLRSPERSFKLYLALSVMSSLDSAPPLGHAKPADTPGSIQIWSTFPTSNVGKGKGKGKGRAMDMDVDEEDEPSGDWDMSMQLEMVLCFEGGMSPELKWCPVGAQDEVRYGSLSTSEGTGRPMLTCSSFRCCSWTRARDGCPSSAFSPVPSRMGRSSCSPCQIRKH